MMMRNNAFACELSGGAEHYSQATGLRFIKTSNFSNSRYFLLPSKTSSTLIALLQMPITGHTGTPPPP
jgi:hypothetical protein